VVYNYTRFGRNCKEKRQRLAGRTKSKKSKGKRKNTAFIVQRIEIATAFGLAMTPHQITAGAYFMRGKQSIEHPFDWRSGQARIEIRLFLCDLIRLRSGRRLWLVCFSIE